MTRYPHILFDHDGVLVDTEPLYFQATQTKLAELGVMLPLDEYLKVQAVGGNAWAQALALGATEDEIAHKRRERNALYQALLQREAIDIAGVEDVLNTLKAKFKLAIVTTARQADFDLIHARRNIVPHFDLILTNKDYAHSKPHPEPYLTALQHFAIDAQDALVVEDSERGLQAAVAANIDCACVYHPFTAPQNFTAATYQLNNLNELLEVVMS